MRDDCKGKRRMTMAFQVRGALTGWGGFVAVASLAAATGAASLRELPRDLSCSAGRAKPRQSPAFSSLALPYRLSQFQWSSSSSMSSGRARLSPGLAAETGGERASMPQAVAFLACGAVTEGLFSTGVAPALGGELRFRGTAAITGSDAILCSKLLRRDTARAPAGASMGRAAACWCEGGGDSNSSLSLDELLSSLSVALPPLVPWLSTPGLPRTEPPCGDSREGRWPLCNTLVGGPPASAL